MIIEETKIPNVLPENINEAKVFLAESIINNVYPLFNEIYSGNIEEIKKITKILDEKKKQVLNAKNELEELMNSYKKMKKISKLLDRIEKLINSGLVYDGTLKHEIVVLLKIITKLSDEKLDFHLKEILRTISKRFSL
jgi:ATP-dependent Lon protease